MRRVLVVLFCVFFSTIRPAFAAETAAERVANGYAASEVAAAPLHGNLPDYTLPPAELAKAQHLAALHRSTYFLDEVWGIVQLVLLLALGGIAWMRDRAVRASRNRWVQGYTFLLQFLLAGFLLNLPLQLYLHHVSVAYGLSIQGWGGWLADEAKAFALEWLVGGLLLMLLFFIIRRLPQRWWLVFWACTIPITLFGAFVQPYIEPLFFHYEPLAQSNPALVQRLEEVVRKGHMDIPPERMFLMQASSKLTTLNADVEGFGHSKRVVVWDNTLQKLTTDEILVVFGHESGHYVLGHIVRGLLLSFVGGFVLFFLAFHVVRWLLSRFGSRWRIPSEADWGTLAVLLLAFAVFSAVLEPLTSAISRTQEHAADVYGQEAVHGLVADPQGAAQHAFDVLGATSLADPNPSRWYEFWVYDHPATGRRAAFAHAYNPWLPGYAPKYFPPATR